MTTRLAELLAGLPVTVRGDPGVAVTGLAQDSRRVEPGFLFVALEGTCNDGHRFVGDAVSRGASAVLVARDIPVPAGVTVGITADTRAVLPVVASRFFSAPSLRVKLLGITGTNGKTTVSYLLEHILARAGFNPGVIGTVNYRFLGETRVAPNTTPDLLTFQALLADMAGAGVDAVVAEVSSHALDQGRVSGLHFDAALFTNFSRDHLDYHGSLDAYFQAKRRLFDEVLGSSDKRDTLAVLNAADPHGRRMSSHARADRVWRFATGRDVEAEVRVTEATLDARGVRARFATPVGEVAIVSPLLGPHSLENLVAAAAVAVGLGVPPSVVSSALASSPRIPGRLEEIPGAPGFKVLVDYAHTPGALESVLAGLRPLFRRAVITVFGCGGGRDQGKRPLMGKAAASLSELTVVTSDNPRHEDPEAIIDDVLPGVLEVARPWSPGMNLERGAHRYAVVADRREAIALALEAAREGDLVLIAGKGHERTQTVGDRQLPLDDREVARNVLASLEGKG